MKVIRRSFCLSFALLLAGLATHAGQRPLVTVVVQDDEGWLNDLLDRRYHEKFISFALQDILRRLDANFPCMEWSANPEARVSAGKLLIVIRRIATGLAADYVLNYRGALERRPQFEVSHQPALSPFAHKGTRSRAERDTRLSQQVTPFRLRASRIELDDLESRLRDSLEYQFKDQQLKLDVNEFIRQISIADSLRFSAGETGATVMIPVDARKMRLRPGANLFVRVVKTPGQEFCPNGPAPKDCFIFVSSSGIASNDDLQGVFQGIPCCNGRWPLDLAKALPGNSVKIYLGPDHQHCETWDDACTPPTRKGAE